MTKPDIICTEQQNISLPSPSTYFLYGLHIHSRLPLPCPPLEDEDAEVEVFFEGLVPRPPGNPPKTLRREWKQENNHWILRYSGKEGHVLEFLFDLDGKKIRLRQSYPEWQNSIFVLVMAALAASLHLQGRHILHATSLVREQQSFLLAGVNGSGKSSFAAALVAEGLALHADDIGAFIIENNHPLVHAGYPRLKITNRTAAALGWDARSLKTIFPASPEYDEKWLDVTATKGGFYGNPAPLRAIYVLSGRSKDIEAPWIKPIPKGQGALALTRHLYGYPWLQKPGGSAMTICARLAENVPIFTLGLPQGLDKLRSAAHLVIPHMDEITRSLAA